MNLSPETQTQLLNAAKRFHETKLLNIHSSVRGMAYSYLWAAIETAETEKENKGILGKFLDKWKEPIYVLLIIGLSIALVFKG